MALLFLIAAVLALTAVFGTHRVPEGFVGIYFRGACQRVFCKFQTIFFRVHTQSIHATTGTAPSLLTCFRTQAAPC